MFHSLKQLSFSALLLLLITISFTNLSASSDEETTYMYQADQAVTAITLPAVQQALLRTEKIGYQFGHKPVGDQVTFASPYPDRYYNGSSNDCVAFDGNITDGDDGTGDYYWASTARYNIEPLGLPYDVPRSALWVAAGGNRGFRPLVSPPNNDYANAPTGIKSRLVCGPYDLSKSTQNRSQL